MGTELNLNYFGTNISERAEPSPYSWENSHRTERKQWGFFSISNSLGYHVEYHWSSGIDSIEPSAAEDDHECDQRRQVWLIPIAAERVGVQVELWNPSRTRAIPERFCGGDSLYEEALYQVLRSEVELRPYTRL